MSQAELTTTVADTPAPAAGGRRILIVVTFANVAGAQIAALRLARGLADRGYAPRVVFLYQQVAIPDPTYPYEVLLPRDHPGARGYLTILARLLRVTRATRPEAVLTFLPLAHAFGQFCAVLSGVGRRIAAHRMPVDTAQRPLRLIDLAYAWTGVYTGATAVSKAVLRSAGAYPARLLARTPVIYNGLLDWTPSTLTQAQARRKFGLPGDGPLIVVIGRFVAQKNYPLLVRVMAELKGITCVIAGDGPLRGAVEADIAARGLDGTILRLGNVKRADMPHLIRAGDLFVQTSTYEGNSNSMIEGLASGAVILAHDVPEQREVLDMGDGRMAGRLIPLNDVAAWTAAIEALAADAPARAELAKLAAERAPAFRYDAMLDAYERVLA